MKTALILALLFTVGCAGTKPPNLTPTATRAWYATEVIKDLERVGVVANDAHSTAPPLITAAEALRVQQWEEVAITIAHDAKTGWQNVVAVSIDRLKDVLSSATWQLIEPYIGLVKEILKAVQS